MKKRLVRLCDAATSQATTAAKQEESKFYSELEAQFFQAKVGFVASATDECPNFPMPSLLDQIDNQQGIAV